MGILSSFGNWATKPLNDRVDPLNIFLMIGLTIVAVWFWREVLRHIEAG